MKLIMRIYHHLFNRGRMIKCTLEDRTKHYIDSIGWGRYEYMGNDWWLLKKREEWYKN